MGLDNMRMKVFTALAVVASVCGVIAVSNSQWSHETISAVVERVYIKWGPFHTCGNEVGFVKKHECVTPKKSFTLLALKYTLSSGDWSHYQATQAFSVLMCLTGIPAALIGVYTFFREVGALQEMIATALSFAAAACGFLSTVIWAGYANKNQHEYGPAFVLNIVTFLMFLAAAAAAQYERASGIPENIRRHLAFGGALLIALLALIAICLNDWSHSEYIISNQFELDQNWGLFNQCSRNAGSHESRTCKPIKANMSIFGFPTHLSTKQLNMIRTAQAFMIFTVMASMVATASQFVATYKPDMNNIVPKLRLPCMVVTVLCSFITMASWAGYAHTTSGFEYGAAFALNCCVWAIGGVWVLANFRDAQGPAAARDYQISTGEGVI